MRDTCTRYTYSHSACKSNVCLRCEPRTPMFSFEVFLGSPRTGRSKDFYIGPINVIGSPCDIKNRRCHKAGCRTQSLCNTTLRRGVLGCVEKVVMSHRSRYKARADHRIFTVGGLFPQCVPQFPPASSRVSIDGNRIETCCEQSIHQNLDRPRILQPTQRYQGIVTIVAIRVLGDYPAQAFNHLSAAGRTTGTVATRSISCSRND